MSAEERSLDPLDFVRALGVRVRVVNDLEEVGAWIPERSMLLVDERASDETRRRMADEILPEVASASLDGPAA